MIGHNIKLGKKFYRIFGIDPLTWKEETGSISAGDETTKDWNDYLLPLDGFAYWIEKLAIEGRLGFAVNFPRGKPHGAPRGQTRYIYWGEARPGHPKYFPMLVTPPSYPSYALYNPHSAANNSYAWFFGERWWVDEPLTKEEVEEIGDRYTELTNYAGGGIGAG